MASPWRVRGMLFAAAVLLTPLMVPPAASAAPRSEAQAAQQTGFGILRMIPELWHTIQGLFEKEGSSPDPFGGRASGSVFEKAGSSPDPFGNPKPNTAPDTPAAGSLAGR